MKFMEPQKQLEIIKKGTAEIISEAELLAKLSEGRKLRIKYGADPTRPDLHLGHAIPLRKLREFQELGHEVLFLIGDFTATVGDPSGKSEIRPALTPEEARLNAETYAKQAYKILDKKRTKIVFNSKWLEEMNLREVVELASKQTVARVLERDEFQERLKKQEEISVLEFFYPLLQAYDSVHLKADIELGGTDQKFNFLMGRTIQERYGQKAQVVITMPLLEGTDGVRKMSKSYNNYIALNDSPREIFGKTMSISDKLMFSYYASLSKTNLSIEEIENMHPLDAKKKLAGEIVALYCGQKEAQQAEAEFENIFQKKGLPDDLKLETISVKEDKVLLVNLLDLGVALAESKSKLRQLIKQGAVKVNEKRISDINIELELEQEYLIQAGKRVFKKVILKKK